MVPPEREPLRTCLGCRRRRTQRELIRIVRDPGGVACFDLEHRLPGRGAWVCPCPRCLDRLDAGALTHVLRAPVALPPAPERRRVVADALRRRVANLLTMARRARTVTIGPAGVRAVLAAGSARLVLTAADQPPDTDAAWRSRAGAASVRGLPDAATLGTLLGTRAAPVAAVTDAGLAGALAAAIDRWETFLSDSCDNKNSGTKRVARVAPGDAAAGGG